MRRALGRLLPRLSLRAKLLAGVLLLLAPILGLLVYSFGAAHERERALVLDDLTQTARAVALLLDTAFQDALTLAGVLAEDPTLRTLDPASATATLQRVHRHYPALENLELVDLAGNEVAASAKPPGVPPRNRAGERHFQQVMATGAPALSGVLVSPDTGRPIVVAAAPITDPSGRRIGAVLLSLRAASANVGATLVALQLGALEDRLRSAVLAPGQAIFVADPGGTLAFHTGLPDERWEARDASGWPGVEAVLGGQPVRTTNFHSPITGDLRAAALVPTPRFGWVVGVTWLADDAFGARDEAFRQQVLLFGAIALLALLAAAGLATYLTRPVARLAATAQALGRGDLGRRVAIRTGDELELLGGAFNRMAADLQAAQRPLRMLAEAGALFGRSLDLEATLAQVARAVVPGLADWCIVDVVTADRSLQGVGVAHVDPGGEERLHDLRRRYQPELGSQTHPVARVVRTGEPEVVPDVTDAHLERMARDAPHLAMLRELGARSFMCVPLGAHGRTLGAITLATGASGRRFGPDDIALAEELARRAALAVDNARLYQMAERAIRVRDEFLASASHELRTPLGNITGFVGTLQRTDVAWDEAQRREFLAEIGQEAGRLARLIDDLLDLSRLESGGLGPSEWRPAHPAALVEGGLARVRAALGDRTVLVEVPPDLPPVLADGGQLERVVANVLENAARHAPPGTPVRITGGVVDDDVELRVEDEGPGIPPEHLERIFEKFFRGRPDGPPGPGLGLGLYITRAIVEAHGGRIWAENRAEGGARFVVRLRRAPAGEEGRR